MIGKILLIRKKTKKMNDRRDLKIFLRGDRVQLADKENIPFGLGVFVR